MKKNLLVTLADKNYISAAKQLFASVYFNSGWTGDYMLLSYDIPDEDLVWFKDRGIIVNKEKSYKQDEDSLDKKLRIYWMKLNLLSYGFKKWKNVVFLDSDIIVRGPIEKLSEVRGFAAVKDYVHKIKHTFKKLENDGAIFSNIKKQFNFNTPCFNCGVMAFSTDIIEEKTFQNLINLIELYKHDDYFTEQDALNVYFYKKWESLPIVYNIHPLHITHRFFVKNHYHIESLIIHFPGDYKPWDKKYTFYKEWKRNFDIANLIDTNKILKSSALWDEEKITRQSKYLNLRLKLYYFLNIIDRRLGRFGIYIKKHYPKIYSKIGST